MIAAAKSSVRADAPHQATVASSMPLVARCAAALFGLFWLGWILWTQLDQGPRRHQPRRCSRR